MKNLDRKEEIEFNSTLDINFEGYNYIYKIDKYINQCPKCNHAIIPKALSINEFLDTNIGRYKFSITYICPNCFNSFIAQYTTAGEPNYGHINKAFFDFVGPQSHKEEIFSNTINDVSPDFVNFYNQALTAEQIGLTDVAGPGYRKSLEFLVKDFAKRNYPDSALEIEKATLAQCINNYLDDSNMKRVVQAATWIGNDQTHYKQKHIDRNLNDLKGFIKVALSYIEFTERTNDAIAFTTK
ncbi:hypothetical protein COK46_01740 [Bacillus thuringiensis]|uniref:DUF4145 domain-containing protein n=1 Tax=Bacillus thuringiensis TaxID=1428 RepID=UPI000BF69243|nr:DUF4145 domain-containing protein [Bacillus thuringiensis]MRD36484.1 DUF4145 domain-containing protein [Bacillus thuringiensis]PFS24361.1 hypothetical protein COK46_01740 [Bacillus thuringiensis]